MHAGSIAKGIVATKPIFLDIVPLHETTIIDTHFSTMQTWPEVVQTEIVDPNIENDTQANLYVVEPLSAGASPDKLRAALEDALDT